MFGFTALAQTAPRTAALTRDRVAELVRRAPVSRVAQAEVGVARAAVKGAGVVSLDNPMLSAMGGTRFNPNGTRPVSAVATLSWPVELGKRGTRLEAARAEQRAAEVSAEGTQRDVLLQALVQHGAVLRDEGLFRLALERHAVSQRLLVAAQKRKVAGSAAEVDVALAELQERQDRATAASTQGGLRADRLTLFALLGISAEQPQVVGDLVPAGEVPTLKALLAQINHQVDVRAARAAIDAARQRVSRERSQRAPTLSILGQYERDDEANIVMLGLALPLPFLNPNRAGVVTSEAEVDAAARRADAIRNAAAGRLRELYARYQTTKDAVDALAPAAELAARAIGLAARGYELGENDLASVLLVRREAITAQTASLDAQYQHANVKMELLILAGRPVR
jgi:cobalt-zinc-cadmium efflux system outer membrane protein